MTDASGPGDGGRFSLLVVCTANICRSPALELLLRARVDHGLDVASAGTEASPGHEIAAPMAALLDRRDGIDASGFRSRRLERQMVESADLILTAARSHRAVVTQLCPGALPRTFTVREFLRIAQPQGNSDGGTDAHARGELIASASRRREAPLRLLDDDIPDPYGRSKRVHARSLDGLREDASRLSTLLGYP